jgi:CDP-diacylglycerol--glycerol-3-phosphate 3-phosphatidyltransferase
MTRAAAPVINLANAITLARALTAPVLVALVLAADGPSVLAAVLFAAAAASDALDGHIARARGEVTRFGTMIDPFVDKLLIGAGLTALAATSRVGVWVVLVVLSREVAVTWMRGTGRRDGILVGARAAGKAKMMLQSITVTVLIAAPDPGLAWVDGLVWAMVAATLLSGLDYALELRDARSRRVRHPHPVTGS